MILNVCETLGENLGIDPWILRFVFMFFFFVYGLGILTYLVLGVFFALTK